MLPKPPNGYLPADNADIDLQQFVFAKHFDMPAPLPKRAEPKQVDEFVRKQLKDMPSTPMRAGRLGELTRFFDLRGVAPLVADKLNKKESGEKDWLRAVILTGLLADIGDDKQAAQATDYAKYLAGRPAAADAPDQLIGLWFSLPQNADAKFVTDLIDAESKKAGATPDGIARKAELAAHMTNLLPRVERARKRKFEILGIKDAKRRRSELARVYLELEVYPLTAMHAWSVMMLQRECNDSKPEDLADTFAQILNLMMSPAGVIGASGVKLAADEEPGILTRDVRAIEFYLGKLTDPQRDFFEKKGSHRDQDDMLWWEPPPPASDESQP